MTTCLSKGIVTGSGKAGSWGGKPFTRQLSQGDSPPESEVLPVHDRHIMKSRFQGGSAADWSELSWAMIDLQDMHRLLLHSVFHLQIARRRFSHTPLQPSGKVTTVKLPGLNTQHSPCHSHNLQY